MEMPPPPPPTFMGACEKEIELKVRKNTVKLKLQTTFLAYFTFFTYNYLFIFFFFVSQDFLVESAPPLLSTCMYITCTDKKPTFFSLHISALRIFCYRKHSQNSHSIAQLILSIIILILDFCGFTKMISIAIF